jgi:hypothetical protein
MFHMTLKYPMQLLDELPMIYGSCVFIYCMAQVKSGKKNRAAVSTTAAHDSRQLRLHLLHGRSNQIRIIKQQLL